MLQLRTGGLIEPYEPENLYTDISRHSFSCLVFLDHTVSNPLDHHSFNVTFLSPPWSSPLLLDTK